MEIMQIKAKSFVFFNTKTVIMKKGNLFTFRNTSEILQNRLRFKHENLYFCQTNYYENLTFTHFEI